MTLKEFCKLNPQLPCPPTLKPELTEKIKTMDLSLLNEKIHNSQFLLSRCSLTWVLSKYQEIIDGVYYDFYTFNVNEFDETTQKLLVHISRFLRGYRTRAKLSQADLSEKTGLTLRAIERIENAEEIPDIITCVQLANLYDITLEELIGFKKKESKS